MKELKVAAALGAGADPSSADIVAASPMCLSLSQSELQWQTASHLAGGDKKSSVCKRGQDHGPHGLRPHLICMHAQADD